MNEKALLFSLPLPLCHTEGSFWVSKDWQLDLEETGQRRSCTKLDGKSKGPLQGEETNGKFKWGEGPCGQLGGPVKGP